MNLFERLCHSALRFFSRALFHLEAIWASCTSHGGVGVRGSCECINIYAKREAALCRESRAALRQSCHSFFTGCDERRHEIFVTCPAKRIKDRKASCNFKRQTKREGLKGGIEELCEGKRGIIFWRSVCWKNKSLKTLSRIIFICIFFYLYFYCIYLYFIYISRSPRSISDKLSRAKSTVASRYFNR